MQSVQTKETPTALSNLLRAKGQRPSGNVQTPVATVVDTPLSTEVIDTIVQEPVIDNTTTIVEPQVTATPIQNLDPNDGRDSEAYRNLKAYHDKSIYEERQKVKQLSDENAQLKVTKKVEIPKTKEELQAFKEKNRDGFDIIRSIVLEELSGDTLNDINRRLDEVNQATAKLEEREAFKKLLEQHPDALEIKQSAKFLTWFNEQPDEIKNILAHGKDIRAVAKQLTLYKIESGLTTDKDKKKADSERRVDDSIGIDTKNRVDIKPAKKVWTKTELDSVNSNYKLWEKHRVEIDEARREGRVDMSK